MPFKKIDIKTGIKEKCKNDHKFNKEYRKIKTKYKIINVIRKYRTIFIYLLIILFGIVINILDKK